jgi:hypothetical protein
MILPKFLKGKNKAKFSRFRIDQNRQTNFDFLVVYLLFVFEKQEKMIIFSICPYPNSKWVGVFFILKKFIKNDKKHVIWCVFWYRLGYLGNFFLKNWFAHSFLEVKKRFKSCLCPSRSSNTHVLKMKNTICVDFLVQMTLKNSNEKYYHLKLGCAGKFIFSTFLSLFN